MKTASSMATLSVRNLQTTLVQKSGRMSLVRGIDFDVMPGETLALVGESGSGKSLTALSIMRLLARNAQWDCQGEVWFREGPHISGGGASDSAPAQNLLSLAEPDMRTLRGHQVAMIFQEPMTCLNPVMTVGQQISESVRLHLGLDQAAANARALRALEQVEIPAAHQRFHEYPHQLSGGMRQRVMIAMAMVCEPRLLIADEPTTALDVTIQAQILNLMARLQKDTGMAMLFITHNLGVVAHHAARVAVMYAGQIVEHGKVGEVFATPQHPYTRGLLACLPGRARQLAKISGQAVALQDIPGQAPSMAETRDACSFAPRCNACQTPCLATQPAWRGSAEHAALCHFDFNAT
jgi:peptide/nickel transport system ATP-binding protein